MYKSAILEKEYLPKIHYNEQKMKTSIYQLQGDSSYHRNANGKYYLKEVPDYIRKACHQHAFTKSSVEGSRSDVVRLIQLMRAFEDRKEDSRNLTLEDLAK